MAPSFATACSANIAFLRVTSQKKLVTLQYHTKGERSLNRIVTFKAPIFDRCFFVVRPARTQSNGCKSPNRPDSGKVTAKGKGVCREVESEGSRRQKVGPMNKNLV